MAVIKILSGDPGKSHDAFAILYGEVRDDFFLVLGVQRFNKIDYPDVENWIANRYGELSPHFLVIEKNNTGIGVIDHLRRDFQIPVRAVVTSAYVKDEKKIHAGEVMDKVEMADYMLNLKQNNRIRFPEKLTDEMVELQRQMAVFGEFKSDNSPRRTFHSPGQDHDDTVMALMLALFIARRYLEKGASSFVISAKRFNRSGELKEVEDDPSRGIQSLGTETWYPR